MRECHRNEEGERKQRGVVEIAYDGQTESYVTREKDDQVQCWNIVSERSRNSERKQRGVERKRYIKKKQREIQRDKERF